MDSCVVCWESQDSSFIFIWHLAVHSVQARVAWGSLQHQQQQHATQRASNQVHHEASEQDPESDLEEHKSQESKFSIYNDRIRMLVIAWIKAFVYYHAVVQYYSTVQYYIIQGQSIWWIEFIAKT